MWQEKMALAIFVETRVRTFSWTAKRQIQGLKMQLKFIGLFQLSDILNTQFYLTYNQIIYNFIPDNKNLVFVLPTPKTRKKPTDVGEEPPQK